MVSALVFPSLSCNTVILFYTGLPEDDPLPEDEPDFERDRRSRGEFSRSGSRKPTASSVVTVKACALITAAEKSPTSLILQS